MKTALRAIILLLLGCPASSFGRKPAYDPLEIPPAIAPKFVDLDVYDPARRRDIPIRVYLPATSRPVPVVLFSHGLGGSRKMSSYLGHHWAARGYMAAFVQHPGSDVSVWQGKPPGEAIRDLRGAADRQNFLLRVEDVSAVLDQLERWNRDRGHVLAGRMDLAKVGMSGHSFGAITTQALSGQRFGRKDRFADRRIKAAVVMSPSSPRLGSLEAAFGGVSVPWLLMTGTNDIAPIGHADLKSRLAVFPALPPGAKYELVLSGAEHSAFGDRALPGDHQPRNPNHHRAILALSTAFWDAYLLNDPAAKRWLEGDGPRTVLETDDVWRAK